MKQIKQVLYTANILIDDNISTIRAKLQEALLKYNFPL